MFFKQFYICTHFLKYIQMQGTNLSAERKVFQRDPQDNSAESRHITNQCLSANHLQNLVVDLQGSAWSVCNLPGRPASTLCSTAPAGDLLDMRNWFEPFTRNGYGDRAFSRAAPRLWNKLPLDIRRLPNLGAFKARLKAHLLKLHYGL